MAAVTELGRRVKSASRCLMTLSSNEKNHALLAIADALWQRRSEVYDANAQDIEAGRNSGLAEGLIDRLTLTEDRMEGICKAVREVAELPDPVGVVEGGSVRPNGLRIEKVRVPMGAIGIIFESRPNVTVDGAVLCLKSGNAVLLRGGKEAIHSNMALTAIMRDALTECGLPSDSVALVEDTSRESSEEMMRLHGILDLLIPRGGAGLIQAVVRNATVPVIETGVGNCHIYVEKTAEPDMAERILVNAKTQRVSVCNAAESLLIDQECAPALLPRLVKALKEKGVSLCGCAAARTICPELEVAGDSDFGREYLDYRMSIKVVSGIEEAVSHIAKYSTGHSEAIITRDYQAAERFMNEVDSAAVYVNASTRFTDGGEFGFGAEIGISTQKLHARGPMGLNALTSCKYRIYGNGQIR